MASGKRDVGELTRAVAGELRAVAARANLTQTEIAARADMPLATLGKIMRGVTSIDVEQLYRICSALKVDAFDVLDRAEAARRRMPAPSIAAEIAGLGLSDKKRREVEQAAADTTPAAGEVDERSGDDRRHA